MSVVPPGPELALNGPVCLSVCLSLCVGLSHKPYVQISQTFQHVPVAVDRLSSDGSAICYVLLLFVDSIMFSYNAGNKSGSKTTRMFRPVRQVAAPGDACRLRLCILLMLH